MAITGTTQPKEQGGKLRNYFVNNCTVDSASQVDSPYHDCSVHLKLTDTSNGYNYNLFVNQNFDKDVSGVVTSLAFPDNLNLLHLATGTDVDVDDSGKVNLTSLIGKELAVINYLSNGKYKKQVWQKVGKTDDHDALIASFEKSIKSGYPKDFIGYTDNSPEEVSDIKKAMTEHVAAVNKSDGLPF